MLTTSHKRDILRNMETEQNNTKQQNIEVGALWKKSGKTQTYLSGTIELDKLPKGAGNKIRVVMFSNSTKKNENAPDYRIYLSNAPASNAPTQLAPRPQQVKNTAVKQEFKPSKRSELQSEDDGDLI